MDERDRYWDTMSQTRRQALYLDRYQAHIEKIDRGIDIGAALVSGGGISTWLVHHEFAFVGALAVALTHFFQIVRPHLPYKRQIKPIAALSRELHKIALDAEAEWHDIDGGSMKPGELHRKMISIEKKVKEAELRAFPNSSLAENKRFIDMANADNIDYFSRYHRKIEE